jgi:prolyl 4-hydroxylase
VFYVVESEEFPPPDYLRVRTQEELEFNRAYLNRTGLQWRHYYGPNGPRPPPSLFMWPAKQIGEVHSVESSSGKWSCRGPKSECQSSEKVQIDLEVVSLFPRAFVIPNFFSTFEADEIVRLARPHMAGSEVGDEEVGAFASDTRTSRNTWIRRNTSAIIESIFLRVSHLLQIDEKLLDREQNCEDMQVVHYINGQKYDSHHDWGVSGYAESRYITLLLYLTDLASPTAGGETSFPKGAGGNGFKVKPVKGNSVLFYNLLEDGNGDDLAVHAALPVYQGEKWLANFWVWDPKRK